MKSFDYRKITYSTSLKLHNRIKKFLRGLLHERVKK